MGNYSFYCKHCGSSHSFDTKEDKKEYEKFHYRTDKRYPGVKICKNLIRTTYGTVMRRDAAEKIDLENQKKNQTLEMDWDKFNPEA